MDFIDLETEYQKVLGLTQGESKDQQTVDAAFRNLAVACHPDSLSGSEDGYEKLTNAYNHFKTKNLTEIRAASLEEKPSRALLRDLIEDQRSITQEDPDAIFSLAAENQKTTNLTIRVNLKDILIKHAKKEVFQQNLEYYVNEARTKTIICNRCRGDYSYDSYCNACKNNGYFLEDTQNATSQARRRIVLSISPEKINEKFIFKGKGDRRSNGSYEDLVVKIKFTQEDWILHEGSLIRIVKISLKDLLLKEKVAISVFNTEFSSPNVRDWFCVLFSTPIDYWIECILLSN